MILDKHSFPSWGVNTHVEALHPSAFLLTVRQGGTPDKGDATRATPGLRLIAARRHRRQKDSSKGFPKKNPKP